MKAPALFLVLSAAIAQLPAHALECDINVSPESYAGNQRQVIGNGRAESTNGAAPTAESRALADCVRKGGGETCRVNRSATDCEYHDNGASVFEGLPWVNPTYKCTAVATGYVVERVSASQQRRLRQQAVCAALDICIANFVRDPGATRADLERVDYLKERNNCQ